MFLVYWYIYNVNFYIGLTITSFSIVYQFVKQRIQRRRRKYDTIAAKLNDNVSFLTDETLDMMPTIKMFSKEHKHEADIMDASER